MSTITVSNQSLEVAIQCLFMQMPHLLQFGPELSPSSYLNCFLFSVRVILRHHSRADEDRDWIADTVQAEGGPGPHQSRGPPQTCDLMVHRRDPSAVCYWRWTGHDAQKFLHREEKFCCSHHLELRGMMLLQTDENVTLSHRNISLCLTPKMS